jgi:phage protein D
MADLGSTSALYAARPRISLDGEHNPDLTEGLQTLMTEETSAGLFRCEATFGNWGTANGGVGYLYFDRQVLDYGKTLSVRVGDGDAARRVFTGRITGLEGQFPQLRPPAITVLAEDRFQDLRMTRRTRSFEDVSDRDVIQHIAAQHSLRTDIDIDGPTYRVLAQVNQSDLAFLRERARAIDAEIWVEDDTLFAHPRSQRNNGDVALTYGQGLREFSALADLANQRTSLTVSGWDVAIKEGVEYRATEAALGNELNGFRSGASVLQRAFGQRPEHIVHLVPASTQEAQVLAESQYRMMARRFVTGQGESDGDGRIRIGTYLNLRGLGVMFDGRYCVTEVYHTFDGQNGYRTRFSVERPGIESS